MAAQCVFYWCCIAIYHCALVCTRSCNNCIFLSAPLSLFACQQLAFLCPACPNHAIAQAHKQQQVIYIVIVQHEALANAFQLVIRISWAKPFIFRLNLLHCNALHCTHHIRFHFIDDDYSTIFHRVDSISIN